MQLRAPDGWLLDVERRPARTEPVGAALLLHAMMVDRRSMRRLADFLAERGLEVFLADYRGHGRSGPSVREGGSWSYDDLVRLDSPTLLRGVREAAPGLPLAVVGHSLGGHVTAAAIGTGRVEPPDALVLLSSATWDPRLPLPRRVRLARRLAMGVLRRANRALGHVPARRLRFGTADEAGPYMADTARFWREGWKSRDGEDYLAALAHVRCPVLGVVSEGDRILGPVSAVRAWFDAFGAKDRTFLVADPDPAPGHMALVTDPRSRPTWESIANWIHRVGVRM